MYNNQNGFTINEFFFVVPLILGFVGYVINIYKLLNLEMCFCIEVILRFIGIFSPFGAIIGWF